MFHFVYKLLFLFFVFGLSKCNQIFLKCSFEPLNTEKKRITVDIFFGSLFAILLAQLLNCLLRSSQAAYTN